MCLTVACTAALAPLALAPAAVAEVPTTTVPTTTVPTTTAPAATTAPAMTTTVAAAASTTAAATTEPATTAPAPSACTGTGILAVRPPGDPPAATGPSIAAADRTGITTASYAGPAGSVVARDVSAGGAGCVDAAGTPGGTSLTTGAWSILGGAVSGTALSVDLVPSGEAGGAGWTLRTTIGGLEVEGRPASLGAGVSRAVGAWGVLTTQSRLDAGSATNQPLRWWASALTLRLTDDHGGLAAGTTLLIGYAAADRPAAAAPRPPAAPVTTDAARPSRAPATTTAAAATTTTATTPPRAPRAVPRKARRSKDVTKRRVRAKRHRVKRHKAGQPLRTTPALGGGPYDFPVFGDVGWSDSYGSDRSDVSGGWHHGDDLFADLGRPVVAVADGTVFAVGWNRLGGWRLWLRDERGNEFYYAHLAGYTALARNSAQVKRGQVLGFVGNTGDAFTTPDHLHFEVHPVGLLYLGYDGAVDPSSYLARWRHSAQVAKLPPAALPDRARHGDGSLSDYRQLLALHRLPRHATAPVAHRHRPTMARTRPTPTARTAAPVVRAAKGDRHVVAAALVSVGCAVAALAGVFAVLRRRRPRTGGEL